ncbi:MAG: YicC/YloC family endoribonuclease [Candidatus Omnitrophota bacterium]|nr:YicC/YloC family endoribonuclease [Candidatus Omnitrophota bacterium]
MVRAGGDNSGSLSDEDGEKERRKTCLGIGRGIIVIKSMTGFGKAGVKFKGGEIIVEIKTVNHKFFDASLKLPEVVMPFEDRIKEVLQKKIQRGKVNVSIIYDNKVSKEEIITINKKLAKSYYTGLLSLKKHLGFEDSLGMKDMVALPGVINYEVTQEGLTSLWPKVEKALLLALGRLVVDREKEGHATYRDLCKRVDNIVKMLTEIKSRAHLNIKEYRERFAERVKDLTSGHNIDKGRLEMEVAIFAKNSDISEEIARLKNHLANFKRTMALNGEAGKKIDFIAQELHRETNTIGSKSSDFKISKNVIEIKSEIEKIREQAKNIE